MPAENMLYDIDLQFQDVSNIEPRILSQKVNTLTSFGETMLTRQGTCQGTLPECPGADLPDVREGFKILVENILEMHNFL